MYGQYTKDLGDFARREAAKLKIEERRKSLKERRKSLQEARLSPKKDTPLEQCKSLFFFQKCHKDLLAATVFHLRVLLH